MTIANHEDSEASERSEGTETKSSSHPVLSQSQSQSQSQSCTCTETSGTCGTCTSDTTAEGVDTTQRRRSGIPPGEESMSEEHEVETEEDEQLGKVAPKAVLRARTPSPELIQVLTLQH